MIVYMESMVGCVAGGEDFIEESSNGWLVGGIIVLGSKCQVKISDSENMKNRDKHIHKHETHLVQTYKRNKIYT